MDFEKLKEWDQADPMKSFRQEFHIPTKNGNTVIYFCGNSLGLQPKRTEKFIQQELENWKEKGVEGHFTGEKPWVSYHQLAKKALGHLVGANETEVQAVGSLTTNLHLLLATFYQPKGKRVKLIIEKGAFPSDFYAAHSHMKMKGINPEEHLIELEPTKGGDYLPMEEIEEAISTAGDQLALVLMPGVQYYSGQFFDIGRITKAAHRTGALAGFDLAHAIGNMPMTLHDDQADFAVWCSYKYLNSGAGGIGGMFIHEKHATNTELPRLSGWWGHDAKERFKMANRINPIPDIDGWQLSNANVLSSAAHLAALSIFEEAGIDNLRTKSLKMIDWLCQELEKFTDDIQIITPRNPSERGCQLSLYVKNKGKAAYDELSRNGVICDWREPNVIRIAPTPLYNTFEEMGRFIQLLKTALE